MLLPRFLKFKMQDIHCLVLRVLDSLVLLSLISGLAIADNSAAPLVMGNEVVDAVQFQLQDGALQSDARAALSREPLELKVLDKADKKRGFFSIQELTCLSNTRISCKDIEKRLRNAGALSLWSLNKQQIGDFFIF